MATATFDLSALTLSDPVVSGKGAKSVPVSYGGRPVVWQPPAQKVLFEPSSFSGEEVSRVNLVMRASPEAVSERTALDESLLGLVVQHSTQIFGKPCSLEEARSRYVYGLKQSEKGYEPTWKCKINVSGKAPVSVWDADKQRRDLPKCWAGAQVVPKVTLKSLWIMGKQFGPLFEASDLLLEEAVQTCPF
jgi:hypothetical protein